MLLLMEALLEFLEAVDESHQQQVRVVPVHLRAARPAHPTACQAAPPNRA
jgi:hypothetical protein